MPADAIMQRLMNRRRLFGAACSAMFLFGIVLAILGAIFGLPAMRARLHVDLAQQGDIFLVLYLGVFVSTVLVGPVIDSYGNKVVLGTSGLLVTAALILFSMAASFVAALAAAFLLGFGGGGLNTAANALVADVYPDERGAMLNIVGMFFGFGALVVPLCAAITTGFFSIPQLLLGTAALAIVCTAAYLVLRFPAPSHSAGFSFLASIKAAGNPGVLLFAAVLFFESGNESSIGGWTSTYAGATGASARTATMILAGYWAALMCGRLAAARVLRRLSKPRLVLASGIGAVAGSAVLLASTPAPLLLAGAIVTGFSQAAIYPTTLALAADRYQRLAGTIFGFLFAAGLIGGMLFPFGIGHISQSFGLRAAMLLPLCGAAAIAMLARKL
jgi:FHS family glucose/mannose:H+ symporter-like MFS transporter